MGQLLWTTAQRRGQGPARVVRAPGRRSAWLDVVVSKQWRGNAILCSAATMEGTVTVVTVTATVAMSYMRIWKLWSVQPSLQIQGTKTTVKLDNRLGTRALGSDEDVWCAGGVELAHYVPMKIRSTGYMSVILILGTKGI